MYIKINHDLVSPFWCPPTAAQAPVMPDES
jgi:hypothetical protein